MKRILFLTPHIPSNRAGGENFTRLLLEQLSSNNEIDLVYYRYATDPVYTCPNENVRIAKELPNSIFVKLKNFLMYPLMHPIFSVRFNRRLLMFLKKMIKENHYDLLYLDHTQMALYGKYFPSMTKILMSHDVMAQRYSRKGNFFSKKFVLCGEKKIMKQPNTTIFTFSEKDRNIIQQTYGLDSKTTNFFLDRNVIEAIPEKIDRRIVFLGKWDRADNFDGLKWFFDTCYKHIPKDITISIIGKWLSDDYIRKLEMLNNVEYLGFVENPYPVIANSIATISPVFSGAGVKVKVVESLACGTPVIGSDIAFEGISETFSDFMVKTDSADDYINAITELSLSLSTRQSFKQKFMKQYQKQSIISYINQL